MRLPYDRNRAKFRNVMSGVCKYPGQVILVTKLCAVAPDVGGFWRQEF